MANEAALVDARKQPLEEGKRDRSTIQFPYLDLDEAVKIAKGVHAVGGVSCQQEQLAAHLQEHPESKMLPVRLGAARIYGLVVYSQGTITLSVLGQRICDAQQEKAARVDAFLNVPLYRAIYEKFKGATLPPSSGLEQAMVDLGVAVKQKVKARQVFQRAATQGGFFEYGQDRLVSPSVKSPPPSTQTYDENGRTQDSRGKGVNNGSGGEGGGTRHPLIEGLIKTLPEPETDWPIQGRWKWLQAASNIFCLIYKDSSDDRESLKIEIQKTSAK